MTSREARERWPRVTAILDEEVPDVGEEDLVAFLGVSVVNTLAPEAARSNDAMERLLAGDARADAEVVMRASLRALRLVLGPEPLAH